MARGTPTLVSGTTTGTSTLDDFFAILVSTLTSYQSGGTSAWVALDTISAGTDIVFQSLGDRSLVSGAGDANILARLDLLSAGVRVQTYQDWTPASSTGNRETSSTSGNIGYASGYNNTGDLDYWIVLNDYECWFVMNQASNLRIVGFGSPLRAHIPAAVAGVAKSTNAVVAGSSVTISLDRDISSEIVVGQTCWVQNVTDPSEGTLRDPAIDLATVEAVTSSSITLDTLVADYGVGALVGMDPCPVFQAAAVSSFNQIYLTNHADGTYEGNAQQVARFSLAAMTNTVNDPSPNGLFFGLRAVLDDNDPVFGGTRGKCELLSFWALDGSFVEGDLIFSDYVSGQNWSAFPGLPGANTPALGPTS